MLNLITKIKNLLSEFRDKNNLQNLHLAELEWAHIYKETIRGKKFIEELGISPGRWAGNYSFFYVLTRILSDYQPRKIIEFGLGESSKMISAFIENELNNSTHLIIEQNPDWVEKFNLRFSLSSNVNIITLPLTVETVHQFTVNTYSGIEEIISEYFDFYVIDGPFGSDRYSRYDICKLANNIPLGREFIILIDDFNRLGEKDTVIDLLDIFKKKGIKTYTGIYFGITSQIIIVTEMYKYATTM